MIIPIVSRSPIPSYGPSIAFTDHSYRLQVTCTFLRNIHTFYRSFLSSPGHLYLFTDNHSFYRSFLSSPGQLYLLTDHPYLLQIMIFLSSLGHLIPSYGPSIAFTDHSYRLQVTCTFLRNIHTFYRSLLSSPGHLYLFTDQGPYLLQIIPIVSRSPVPFYGPSIAFTDHSYRLQVTCTFLRTIHSFYRSFLSSPGHLYLFTDNHSFYRSFLSSPGHLYLFKRTIHNFYRSFLSSLGHLYLLTDHP